MPFIDMITGYAFNAGLGSVVTYLGQAYRMILLIYMIYIIYKKNKKKQLWLIGFSIFTIFITCLNSYRFNSPILENLSYTLKLLLPMFMVYCIVIISKNNKDIIQDVFKIYSWVYPLSLIIPRLLGIGYYISNYAFESGYKGFYYANNELNVILMVLFIYCFQKIYDDIIAYDKNLRVIKFNISNIINLLLIIFSLLLIGSKTSIIAILFVCIAYLLKKEKLKYKLKYLIAFFGIFLMCSIIIFFLLNDQINNIIQRIMYAYNRYIDGGFLTFLLSKRNLRIQPGIEYWFNKNNGLINFLFGVGKYAKCPNDSISTTPFALIELDLFDCLFWYGIIITAIVIFFYVSFYFKSFYTKNLFMEKAAFILVFSFSMIAGHVIMSANSGTIFALVTSDLYVKNQRRLIRRNI